MHYKTRGLLKAQIEELSNYFFLERKSVLDWKAIFKLNRFIKVKRLLIYMHMQPLFIGTLIKLFNPKLVLIWHDHYGNSDQLEQRPAVLLKCCSYF